MDLITELNKAYPEESILERMDAMSLELLYCAKDLIEVSIEMGVKAEWLIDAKSNWKGIRRSRLDGVGEDDGLSDDEFHLRHTVNLLSDKYQPSRTGSLKTDNSLLVADARRLHRFFKECGQAAPLPMSLITRGLASSGILLAEMVRSCISTRIMLDGATDATKALAKSAANRQKVADAYVRVANRATKKRHQIVNEIHDKTGLPKTTIRRYLTQAGLLIFKGYE